MAGLRQWRRSTAEAGPRYRYGYESPPFGHVTIAAWSTQIIQPMLSMTRTMSGIAPHRRRP
jgi:hypothetical protein